MIVVLPLLSSPTQTIRTFLLLLLRPSELKSILKRPMAALCAGLSALALPGESEGRQRQKLYRQVSVESQKCLVRSFISEA